MPTDASGTIINTDVCQTVYQYTPYHWDVAASGTHAYIPVDATDTALNNIATGYTPATENFVKNYETLLVTSTEYCYHAGTIYQNTLIEATIFSMAIALCSLVVFLYHKR